MALDNNSSHVTIDPANINDNQNANNTDKYQRPLLNVLITGATGHVGRVLCERIGKSTNNQSEESKEYNHIFALGRNEKIGKELENNFDNVQFIKCDLSDRENVEQELDSLLGHIDVIFHCAALSTSWANPQDLYRANFIGTENLVNLSLKHLKRNGRLLRFVFVGTPSIYMSKNHEYDISENNDSERIRMENLLNDYAKTKLMAEQYVLKLYRDHAFPVVVIRPRAVIGVHDTAILPRITKILKERKFVNISEKNQKLLVDLTYIDNVVDALLLAQKSAKCLGKSYNITNGEPLDLLELCKKLCTEYLNIDLNYEKKTSPDTFVPKKVNFTFAYCIGYLFECVYSLFGIYNRDPPLTRYAVATISRSATFNIENARRDLGYVPRVPINVGIERVMRASKL